MTLLPSDVQFNEIKSYLNKFGKHGEVTLSNKYDDRGLALICLNHPEKKNAITGSMMVQFRDCVEKLENWKEGKAVLICGLNGNFCSGGDLDFARASGTQEGALCMSTWMPDALKRLKYLPLVTFCLVQGPTLGGGAELSLFCDYIIAAEDVKFGLVHGKIGITTAWGGATRLTRKIGASRALKLLLTSQVLSAQQCVENGVADFIVPSTDCLPKAVEWIEQFLQHHVSIVRSFKQVVNAAENDTVQNAFECEQEHFVPKWGAALNRQALANPIKHVKPSNSKM